MRRGASGGQHELEATVGRLAGPMELAPEGHARRPPFWKTGTAELEEVALGNPVAGKPRDRHEVWRRGGLAAEKPQGRNERVKPHVTSVTTVRIFGKIPRFTTLGRLPA